MAEEYTGVQKRHMPRSPLSDLAFSLFGRSTYTTMRQVTAGTVLIELVPVNPNRVGILLTNNSASDIYLGFNPDTALNYGLVLPANGGVFNSIIRDEGEAVSQTIWGIAAVNGLNCTLVETILQDL